MRRVRSKNTRPEMVVRSLAHQLGYRFRLHRGDLAGSPDLVFPSRTHLAARCSDTSPAVPVLSSRMIRRWRCSPAAETRGSVRPSAPSRQTAHGSRARGPGRASGRRRRAACLRDRLRSPSSDLERFSATAAPATGDHRAADRPAAGGARRMISSVVHGAPRGRSCLPTCSWGPSTTTCRVGRHEVRVTGRQGRRS